MADVYTDTEEFEVNPEKEEDPGFIDADAETDIPSPEDKEEIPFTFDEDLPNLVPVFEAHPEGAKALKKLVEQCHEEFKTSWDKNEGYRQKTAESWRVLYCDLPPKNKPYENCANAAIPLALQNVVRYTNKIVNEVFGDWSGVFNFLPTNPKAEMIAPIVTEHSNWQIRNRIVGFKRQMRRGVLIFAVAGDVVAHSYYDPVTKKNCHEILTCDDFVTPFTHVSVSPDFSDVPWVARRVPYFKTKLKAMANKGWSNVDKVTSYTPPEYGDEEATTELRQTIAGHQMEDPFGQQRGEYEIIHYEGWLELPGQKNERYCQLIFDLCSKQPLSFRIHERASYAEKYRYEYQTKEFQEYSGMLQQIVQQQQAQQQQSEQLQMQAMMMPQDSPDVGMMMEQSQMIAQQPLPQPPPKPTWMVTDDTMPEPPAKEPIYMFSHGVCLEPMLGNLGIGIGRIDSQLNLATNTVWSQFLDAATLGNGKTFITAGNVDFRSPFKIGPGVMNKAKNVMPSDLANAFKELDFGAANPQLLQAAGQLMQFGEQASSTPDLMSGAAGKSGETARGYQGRVEQVNSMLQVPAGAFADFVVQIMKNNCTLNKTFMDESEIFYVNRFNDDMEMHGSEMVKVARDFYDNPWEIELVSDMQFKSRAQKISEADEIVQLPKAMPELQMNVALKYEAVYQALKARGLHRMARSLLGPRPPKPQNTFGLPPGTPNTAIGPEMMPPQPPMPGSPPGQGPPGPPGQPPQGGPPPGPPGPPQ
jgi:hypothetical protein